MDGSSDQHEIAAPRDASLPPWAVWAAILGGWTLLSLLLAPELYLHFLGADEPIGWTPILALSLTNTAIAVALAPLIVWLTRRFPLERGRWLRRLALHVAACAAFSLCHSVLYWLLCYASRHGTLGSALFARFHPNLITYWAIVGFTEAMRHFETARRRERQLAEARLTLLVAQLQPHFLFNTLNTIAAMMHVDVWAADRMLNRLSDLLRLALASASRPETTLEHEIQFVQAYVEIQRARFGDGLLLTVDVAPQLRTVLVPSLILQPLVENSIRHGFGPQPGRGTIRVRASSDGAALTLEVVDDGAGPAPASATRRAGLGLANARQRLDQLYPGRSLLSLEPAQGGGAVATVRLPLRYPPRDPIPGAAAPALPGGSVGLSSPCGS